MGKWSATMELMVAEFGIRGNITCADNQITSTGNEVLPSHDRKWLQSWQLNTMANT